jgi:hypothetical protein
MTRTGGWLRVFVPASVQAFRGECRSSGGISPCRWPALIRRSRTDRATLRLVQAGTSAASTQVNVHLRVAARLERAEDCPLRGERPALRPAEGPVGQLRWRRYPRVRRTGRASRARNRAAWPLARRTIRRSVRGTHCQASNHDGRCRDDGLCRARSRSRWQFSRFRERETRAGRRRFREPRGQRLALEILHDEKTKA